MNRKTFTVRIGAGEFKTLGELIRSAILGQATAADYTATQRSEEASRWISRSVREGAITPTADVYLLSAHRGVRNGEVVAGSFVAGDFTARPGGGILLEAGRERHLASGEGLDSLVVYAAAQADIDVDVLA